MINFLKLLCFKAIIAKNIELHKLITLDEINITESRNRKDSHFQFNNAFYIAKKFSLNNFDLLKNIVNYIDNNYYYSSKVNAFLSGNFVNFLFNNFYFNNELKDLFFSLELKKKNKNKNKVLLDYSSPNIAKNMHVGHLRSTVIGDCLANLFLFFGCYVVKVSHLGDWGSQFGLLIAYLKLNYNIKNRDLKRIKLDDLSCLYKKAKANSNIDDNFLFYSRNEVVKLQKKDKESIFIWKSIVSISKKEYSKIYKLLNIKISYKGESFYSNMLDSIVKFFEKKSVVEISDGAKCIYLNKKFGFNENLPLLIKKNDGAYNYTTTELASLYYRIKYHKPDKIIYITDIGQSLHFKMVFSLFSFLKISDKIDLVHIPLGLMLNSDGKKIRTRSGFSEKLIDVLFEAIIVAKNIILKKGKNNNKQKLLSQAKILGINTLKYSDLSNKLSQNYIFDKDIAFKNTGNTASFLMYAYVRICGIKKKCIKKKLSISSINFDINETSEVDLVLTLLMYDYFLLNAFLKMDPNILTNYTYRLADKFHCFFNECNVINSTYFNSRYFLCDLTERVLFKCFSLLGLTIVKEM